MFLFARKKDLHVFPFESTSSDFVVFGGSKVAFSAKGPLSRINRILWDDAVFAIERRAHYYSMNFNGETRVARVYLTWKDAPVADRDPRQVRIIRNFGRFGALRFRPFWETGGFPTA